MENQAITAATDEIEAVCLVGKAPCGHYRYARALRGPVTRAELSEMIEMLDEGWTLETKPVRWVQEGGLNLCDCRKKAKP